MNIDCNFPGGNILVDRIEGDQAFVHQDLRDTTTDWFYWCFRLSGAAGRAVRVTFTGSNVIGVRGPAVSLDGGVHWQWLGAAAVEEQSFTYAVPAGADDVRFSFGMPYLETNLRVFLQQHTGDPALAVGELCRTRKGRSAELLHLGRLDGKCRYRMLLTCRHHCCEMMASYALEGILDSILAEDELGAWFRDQVEVMVVPFVDKDGVEDGDQGKNRAPRDHNRDYDHESVHPTTRAIRQLVPSWSEGRLRLAMDLHCPHIRGLHNEDIYFPGGPQPHIWEEVLHFSKILERVQRGPLVFSAGNNLPFGVDWNVAANTSQGMSFGGWAAGLEGVRLSNSLELPYANASGREVNQQTARAFGRDLAVAIQAFLEE
jgi:hypothetical protein